MITVTLLFLFICSLFVNPKKEYEKDSCFYRSLLNATTVVITKLLRIRMEARGIEKIPEGEKALFVCNHLSRFDPIASWWLLRAWLPAFISKPENFKVPFYGRFIRKCCFMAIDRGNPRNAIVTVNKAAELLKRDEVSIVVYPEGTRSRTGKLLPFHNGVFKIAQKAGKPVVVLSVTGTEEIPRNLRRLKPSRIILNVIEVIPAETAKALKSGQLGDMARDLISANLPDGSAPSEPGRAANADN